MEPISQNVVNSEDSGKARESWDEKGLGAQNAQALPLSPDVSVRNLGHTNHQTNPHVRKCLPPHPPFQNPIYTYSKKLRWVYNFKKSTLTTITTASPEKTLELDY